LIKLFMMLPKLGMLLLRWEKMYIRHRHGWKDLPLHRKKKLALALSQKDTR